MPLSEIIEAQRGRRVYKPLEEIYLHELVLPDTRMTEYHPMGANPPLRFTLGYRTWFRDVLGYLAPVHHHSSSMPSAWFRDSTDAELFRLAFIEYWQ
jgi:hypothetical protein